MLRRCLNRVAGLVGVFSPVSINRFLPIVYPHNLNTCLVEPVTALPPNSVVL